MAYGYFKVLSIGTASYKLLRDKSCKIAKNLKYDRYQRSLASMVYIFFDKKSAAMRVNTTGTSIKSEVVSKQQLVEKINKPTARKFEKRKLYSYFKDNIWSAVLADMQLICKYNKVIPFFYM